MAGEGSATDMLAAAAGVDPAALLGGGGVSPFPQGTAQMVLYAGSKKGIPTPAKAGPVPLAGGAASQYSGTYKDKFHGRAVTINMGSPLQAGWRVEIHSNLGKQDPEEADPGSVQLWVEFYNEKGESVYKQQITDSTTKSALLGRGTPSIGPAGRDSSIQVDVNMADFAAEGGKPTPDEDVTKTIEEELKTVYSLPEPQMRKIKTQLWLAGYYGDTPLEQINMTTVTAQDVEGLTNVMLQAARYFNAGKKITWQGLLSQLAADPASKNLGENETTAVVSDPQEITAAANAAATEILGRAPTPQDVQTLIGLIHGREKRQNEAIEQKSGSVEATNNEAQIEQYFREKYPNEAFAVDYGSRATIWEDMLRTSSPTPKVVSLG
jgi:hypothetical protein